MAIFEPTLLPIAYVTEDSIGEIVKVTGSVERVYYHSKGHIFVTLKEDNTSITIPIFSNVAEDLQIKIEEGQILTVTGEVTEYKGKLEVIPRRADDIKLSQIGQF
jgi:exodeoxyribonuclease VII large subunit